MGERDGSIVGNRKVEGEPVGEKLSCRNVVGFLVGHLGRPELSIAEIPKTPSVHNLVPCAEKIRSFFKFPSCCGSDPFIWLPLTVSVLSLFSFPSCEGMVPVSSFSSSSNLCSSVRLPKFEGMLPVNLFM
mmetsp:Transcript_24908/g.30454  ORF Transcript_24908/g.30454 Transcript_24908/m.30454 type:complete len:130 (-) Transcript_24908:182-571(-)